MQLTTRKTCLERAAIVTSVTGVIVALAAFPATALPARLLSDLIYWPFDGAQSLAAPETRLLAAIGGGVMAGWGLMMWALVRKLFIREPAAVKSVMTSGLVAWFAVDSGFSVLAGAPLNVAFNAAFLALFLVPLRGEIASEVHI